jgi:hypothetical protein
MPKPMRPKCPECQRTLPQQATRTAIDPLTVPCGPLHVRCVTCLWPVAHNLIGPTGECNMCDRSWNNKLSRAEKENDDGDHQCVEPKRIRAV